ncbi:hypothetical protein E3Q19_03571 [Wallemia mellicola]|nr:hypothetical protein E3Q19_03571 [Wallemia mellicola]
MPKKSSDRLVNACYNCRNAKSKCTTSNTESSCDRCNKRGLECVVDSIIRRRGKDRKPRVSNKRKEASKESSEITDVAVRSSTRQLSNRTSSSTKTSSITTRNSTKLTDNSHKDSIKDRLFSSNNNNDILHTTNFPEFAYQTSFNQSANSATVPLLFNPTSDYQQSTYWDVLIMEKMSEYHIDRNTAIKHIVGDLWIVFSRADLIATMFHLPTILEVIRSQQKRDTLEPALIYILLAISYAMQGRSDKPCATQSKLKALNYAETSYTHLMSAMSTNKMTLGVAQAAICLQYYELFPKPIFDVQKTGACLVIADAVIRTLALTCLDADKVEHVYDDDGISITTTDLETTQQRPLTPISNHSSPLPELCTQPECNCQKWTYDELHMQKKEGIRFRFLPRFAINEISDEKEIKDEEIRRVVWTALNQSWYQQMFQPTLSPLYINDSSNYGIFLTSERYVSNLPNPTDRDWSRRTLYALLDRGKLLCHGAMRLRLPLLEFHIKALKIVREADIIETELEKHTCHNGIPRWQVSNVVFLTKLVLTVKLRRITDFKDGQRSYFTRIQAKKWLGDHGNIYRQFIGGGIKDAPMILGVLTVQALRCLDLYGIDGDLVMALYVSRGILAAIEQLLHFHPCDSPDVQRMLDKVRNSCNFEHESMKKAFKPPNPPPHPPTFEELQQYIVEHNTISEML